MKPADVYTVSRLLGEVRRLLKRDFAAPLWLKGELSNFTVAASGHMYFTIKDHYAQIHCAMFRGKNQVLKSLPDNGEQVVVRARPDCYEPRGDLQLIVERMELSGVGELQRRFEALKQKLDREGLFDEARKRALPAWPRTIGVVTSPSAAALRDVIAVVRKRCAMIRLIVYPTPVQGAAAAAGIVEALDLANRHAAAELLLLVRGGGSLEDLQAFNDEDVARKIAASRLPVASGIGHEIDFTIADFVSDYRAPTPSAAAAHVSPDAPATDGRLRELARRLAHLARAAVNGEYQRARRLQDDLLRFHPAIRVRNLMQQFDELHEKLGAGVKNRLSTERLRCEHAGALLARGNPRALVKMHTGRLRRDVRELSSVTNNVVSGKMRTLEKLAAKLEPLSPYATLKRGYAIAMDKEGRIIRLTTNVRKNQPLEIRVEDGNIAVKVT